MNNKEFIAALAQQSGHTQADTQKMVNSLLEEIGSRFEVGDSLQVTGFGTFEVKKRLERIIVNPGTQQRMLVPPKLVLGFKPVASVKDELRNS